ncbi:MAG TPA: large conductance mechanosensitive channel protein MscL [Clostridiales bacterium]|nr:large conductance mechanosensitive channel protein MscL [Clostridiales bacterium]HQH63956.1 large conductance mechanosensitive channel protein MscL [Clostridiales bacterium]HQK73678.1 large conductance mechanosensitive channel protein MscL [Clostridiales bacterium]
MEKSKGFIAEFKAFLMRGNVIDLAVGIIIGAAFKAIVDSLVANIIMPVIGLLTGGIDFTNLFVVLKGDQTFKTLADAQAAGVPTLNYGLLISAIINFIIIGFVIFLIVKGMNKLAEKRKKGEPEAAPTTKECPYCKSEINIEATKCPNCTSDV